MDEAIDSTQDSILLQKFAFENVRDKIYERIETVLKQQADLQEEAQAE